MAFYDNLGRNNNPVNFRLNADMARIKRLIAEEEKRIDAVRQQIGLLYTKLHAEDYEPQFKEMMETLQEYSKSVSTLKSELLDLRNVRLCTKCSAEVPNTSVYCSACGNHMPIDESKVVCMNCGKLLPRELHICTACGRPLGNNTPAANPNTTVGNTPYTPTVQNNPYVPTAAVGIHTAPISSVPVVQPINSIPDVPAAPVPVEPSAPAFNAVAVTTVGSDTSPSRVSIAEPSTDNIKICKNCNQPLEEGVSFCTECGTPVNDQPATSFGVAEQAASDVKYCPRCFTVLESGVAFCTECGTKLDDSTAFAAVAVKRCPQCSNVVEEGMAFCTECGTRL